MAHKLIHNQLSVKDGLVNYYITVKPNNRLSEANIITLFIHSNPIDELKFIWRD